MVAPAGITQLEKLGPEEGKIMTAVAETGIPTRMLPEGAEVVRETELDPLVWVPVKLLPGNAPADPPAFAAAHVCGYPVNDWSELQSMFWKRASVLGER